MSDGLLIELGGGHKPRGVPWINVDLCEGADVRIDLSREPLPFADDSAVAVYAAHVLEHIDPYNALLKEIVRVCRVGATVEIRVPHWLSQMALCGGHKQTISPAQVRHWCDDFPQDWFGGCAKRLRLTRTEYMPGEAFHEARFLFPQASNEQAMRLIPDACHEIRFNFDVVKNEG